MNKKSYPIDWIAKLPCLLLVSLVLMLPENVFADNSPTPPPPFLNNNLRNASNSMFDGCTGEQFQGSLSTRCTRMFTEGATERSVRGAFQQVAPQQVVANGTQSTRLTAGQLGQLQGAIDNRTEMLFAKLQGTGNSMLASSGWNSPIGGAASADSMSIGPVGVWFNSSYNMGAISSTTQQLGYDFGNWGATLGADYKPMDNLAIGTAFTYRWNSATFANSLGNTDTDMYTGMLYTAWYPVENFHVDANIFYGGNQYDTTRNINYTLKNDDGDVIDNVLTQAKGNTGGGHWGAGFRTGYNLVLDSLTIEPYGRFNYYALGVDPYREHGWNGDNAQGLALSYGKQNVESLITSLGSQISYAFSYQWGVLIPQFYAEWHHQFKDSSRLNSANYTGYNNTVNPALNSFGIYTTEPTRNFATVGTRLGGSFGHGLSAFVGYDAILGYANVNSQRVMLSGRLEF